MRKGRLCRCRLCRKVVDVRMDFRASLEAQLVKNSPTMQETWIRSLGWEDPLEKEMATHSYILAWQDFIPSETNCAVKRKLKCNANVIAQVVEIHLQCRRPRFDSWVRKNPWRRDRPPTPVFMGFVVAQL